MGVGSGFMWAPISTAATRNLPMDRAGAGAGVYNTTRQVGAVLGSAGIAALMQSRLAAGPARARAARRPPSRSLPPALHAAFATAMAQSLVLPAVVLLVGLAAVLGFATAAAPAAAGCSGAGRGRGGREALTARPASCRRT